MVIIDLVIIAILLYLLTPMLFGAAYYPSSRDLKILLKEIFDKYFRDYKTIKMIDLGSGFGRVCFWASSIDPRVTCVGVEIDPIKIAWSNFIRRIKRLEDRVYFKRGDLFKEYLGEYDLIYMFLWTSTVARLEDKILREARRGAVIVSLEHPFKKIRAYKWRKYYIARLE